MGRPLHFQEHRHLNAFIFAKFRDLQLTVAAETLELHFLLETITRHIFLDRGDHIFDRLLDLRFLAAH